MNLTLKQAQKMESSGIISFKGFSGIVATAEMASVCPQLCQVYASSGNVYDVEFNGTFTLVEAEAPGPAICERCGKEPATNDFCGVATCWNCLVRPPYRENWDEDRGELTEETK